MCPCSEDDTHSTDAEADSEAAEEDDNGASSSADGSSDSGSGPGTSHDDHDGEDNDGSDLDANQSPVTGRQGSMLQRVCILHKAALQHKQCLLVSGCQKSVRNIPPGVIREHYCCLAWDSQNVSRLCTKRLGPSGSSVKWAVLPLNDVLSSPHQLKLKSASGNPLLWGQCSATILCNNKYSRCEFFCIH